MQCEEVGEKMLVSLSFRNRKGGARWIELDIGQFTIETVTPSGGTRFGIQVGKVTNIMLIDGQQKLTSIIR